MRGDLVPKEGVKRVLGSRFSKVSKEFEAFRRRAARQVVIHLLAAKETLVSETDFESLIEDVLSGECNTLQSVLSSPPEDI
jgi:hypothetical protein